jgi:NAD(P)-dependent dehydrogenase (short-subunit alcohol dehydrogenase family)
MSLYSMFAGKGPSGFGYSSTAEDVTAGLSLSGKNILVTGCNSGLGLETMRVLAARGAHVIGTSRTEEKARAAGASAGGKTTGLACELAEPASVRGCVAAVKKLGVRLDAIICNAGIMAPPKLQQAHGYELQFFTNHVGHFILVNGLLDSLADDGRVVILSSGAHKGAPKEGIQFDNLTGEKGYRPWSTYGQSKLANLLFAKELARRLKSAGSKKTANALHPGVIRTNLGRSMGGAAQFALTLAGPLVLKTIPEGAATECYVATHTGAAGLSGEYFSDCNVAKPRHDAEDPALATRLWETTEQIVARA